MSAYVIANVTVKDPVRYEDYRRLVSPTLARFGGRFIARGGQVEVLEGAWHGTRLVLLEFPSMEAARNWWSSPEYAEAKLIRQATSEGTLLMFLQRSSMLMASRSALPAMALLRFVT